MDNIVVVIGIIASLGGLGMVRGCIMAGERGRNYSYCVQTATQPELCTEILRGGGDK